MRSYLDNAATSFPKPPGVAEAMHRYMTENGAPGRGLYDEARSAAGLIRRCRERVCELIGAPKSQWAQVVFGYNTTDALNLGIQGIMMHAHRVRRNAGSRGGEGSGGKVHVVTTTAEHNSVLRPLNKFESEGICEWTRVKVDSRTGLVNVEELASALRPGVTTLVAVNHASNVTGTVQPIEAIGAAVRVRAAGAIFLVDGAQSLGHVPVDVERAKIDLLAFPGHKGLLGPQGTGGLWIRPGVEQRLDTVREGGTGNVSELESHPTMMPEKYEAGSHNTVGIAGLSEGIAWLQQQGIARIREHELELISLVLSRFDPVTGEGIGEGRNGLQGLHLLGLAPIESRVGVFSFVHDGLSPAELSTVLEMEYGILSRPGLHCAPLMHRTIGSWDPERGVTGGACRLSIGPFTPREEVERALAALAEICHAHRESLVRAK